MTRRETAQPLNAGADTLGNRPVEPKQPPAPSIRAATPESMSDPNMSKERIEMERNRRMFVKRTGGLRLHLHPDDVKLAEELCKKYGRPAAEGWDPAVFIPGYDNCNHEVNRHKRGEVK